MSNPITRNLGNEISLSDAERDAEVDSKSPLTSAELMRHYEDSISSISSRVLWLDADHAPSITLDGTNVQAWTDRLVNARITYDDATPLSATEGDGSLPIQESIIVNGTERKVVRFSSPRQVLSLNETLDSLITGEGLSFTLAVAGKFGEILRNDYFMSILTKWDGDDGYSSFWLYLYDSPTTANVRFEAYSEDDSTNGITAIGTTNISSNVPYSIIASYNTDGLVGLERVAININGAEVKSDTSFEFGDGLVDITDGDASLTIGDHAGSEFAGYKSFVGDLYEIIIFNKALNADEKALLNSYFATKWGVGR